MRCLTSAIVACSLVSWCAVARAGDDSDKEGAVSAATVYRASDLMGMGVRNPEGEDLGKIEDLVIDMENGRVRYAALSFGGFLSVGDKLFAVPMKMLTMKHEADEHFFVLDVDKERLEKAPGFNKDAWPDFGDPTIFSEVDKFYTASTDEPAETHSGLVVSVADGRLTMTAEDGDNRHSHNIGPDVQITLDGDVADLEDLKKGHHVDVTMAENEGKMVVVAIAGRAQTRRE